MGLHLILFTLSWLPSNCFWCYAFVLLSSSAAAANSRLLELGSSQNFDYTTTVLLNEAGGLGKSVGYRILAGVDISVVWESGHNKLLRFSVSWSVRNYCFEEKKRQNK